MDLTNADESESIPNMPTNTNIRHRDGRRGVVVRSYPASDMVTVDFGHYTETVYAGDCERDR